MNIQRHPLSPFFIPIWLSEKKQEYHKHLYTAKLTMQHLINKNKPPIQIFIDVAWQCGMGQTRTHSATQKLHTNRDVNLMTHMKAITSTVWGDSEAFPLQTGVPQRDSLSPKIIIFMDTIIRIMKNQGMQSKLLQHSTQGYVRWHMGNSRRLRQGKTMHNAMQTSPQLDGTRHEHWQDWNYSTKDSNKHQNQTHKHMQQSIINWMDRQHNTIQD